MICVNNNYIFFLMHILSQLRSLDATKFINNINMSWMSGVLRDYEMSNMGAWP